MARLGGAGLATVSGGVSSFGFGLTSAFENSAFSWVLRDARSMISRDLSMPRLSKMAPAKSASLASFETRFALPPEKITRAFG